MQEQKYIYSKWTSPFHIDEIERTVVLDDDAQIIEVRDENITAQAREFHKDLTRKMKALQWEEKLKTQRKEWEKTPMWQKFIVFLFLFVSIILFIYAAFFRMIFFPILKH